MILKNAILADHVLPGDGGKKNILGVFGQIMADNYPTQRSMGIFLQFTGDKNDIGDHFLELIFVDDDYKEKGRMPKLPFKVTQPQINGVLLPVNIELTGNIKNFVIPAPGMYEFHVVLDEKRIGSIPLQAFKIQQGAPS